MNVFVFVLSIIAIVMTADTIQKIAKARSAKRANDADTEELLARIDMLEERIGVLERIVTEHTYDLKREINRL